MNMGKDPKKKICYICYRKPLDLVFEHFSEAVSHHEYDISILTLLDKGQKDYEILNGRKIYRIPLPDTIGAKRRKFLFISKVTRFLKKHDFSIIHIHVSCSYFILIKMFASRDAKFVFHILSYPISTSRFRALKAMIKIFIQCLFMDKIIVQSEELKEHWIGLRSLRKAEIVPVGFTRKVLYPIGENEKHRLRNLLNIHENHPVLVYCGVISKNRQLDRLIEAFKKVHQIYGDIKLLMIGDGNALEEIKALAHSLQIERSIIFTGRIPHDKVVNYIGMADIGISYIPINENYNYNPPLKTFEYLACGLPSIATRTESNCRIIKDGFNGILVNDMPEDVSNSIITLLRDKKKQSWLRENARKSIMAFDFEHITKSRLIPLYQSLLGVN